MMKCASWMSEKLLRYLYDECGIGIEKIAKVLDSNPVAVHTMLMNYEIERRSTSDTLIDKIHAVEILLDVGWSVGSIRRAIGVGNTTIRKIKKENENKSISKRG